MAGRLRAVCSWSHTACRHRSHPVRDAVGRVRRTDAEASERSGGSRRGVVQRVAEIFTTFLEPATAATRRMARQHPPGISMGLLAPQPLALICSLVLALPPGWCGGCAAVDAPAKTHEAPGGCCQASADTAPSGCDAAARTADASEAHFCACCASSHRTPPTPSPAPEAAVPTAWSLAAPHAPVVERLVEVTATPARGGPRLHVLKCVWRC